MNTYERFTARSRTVMQLASQEAQWFNHASLGTEHMLLGLVKEGSGIAAAVLMKFGVDLSKLRSEVERFVPRGGGPLAGGTPHTPQAERVIGYSMEEARSLSNDFVGTEHLLLGLVRESEGVAAQVLRDLGLTREDIRERTLTLLGWNAPADVPDLTAAGAFPYAAPSPPDDAELQLVADTIEQLAVLKEVAIRAHDFGLAATLCARYLALEHLLAWYRATHRGA